MLHQLPATRQAAGPALGLLLLALLGAAPREALGDSEAPEADTPEEVWDSGVARWHGRLAAVEAFLAAVPDEVQVLTDAVPIEDFIEGIGREALAAYLRRAQRRKYEIYESHLQNARGHWDRLAGEWLAREGGSRRAEGELRLQWLPNSGRSIYELVREDEGEQGDPLVVDPFWLPDFLPSLNAKMRAAGYSPPERWTGSLEYFQGGVSNLAGGLVSALLPEETRRVKLRLSPDPALSELAPELRERLTLGSLSFESLTLDGEAGRIARFGDEHPGLREARGGRYLFVLYIGPASACSEDDRFVELQSLAQLPCRIDQAFALTETLSETAMRELRGLHEGALTLNVEGRLDAALESEPELAPPECRSWTLAEPGGRDALHRLLTERAAPLLGDAAELLGLRDGPCPLLEAGLRDERVLALGGGPFQAVVSTGSDAPLVISGSFREVVQATRLLVTSYLGR